MRLKRQRVDLLAAQQHQDDVNDHEKMAAKRVTRKNVLARRARSLFDKSGIAGGLYGMAGVGESADGVENGYEKTIVTKACAGIVCAHAGVKMHVTSQGNESKGQYDDVDEGDYEDAKVRCVQLSAPARKQKQG